jgi:polyhydroxyalkanoate synthase
MYGEEPPEFDVLYWNTDTTRLPAAMHAFYLREFYLNNRLVQSDGLELAGRPIDLRRIAQPLYAVGTEQDHIAPWKETFKICSLVQGPVRYTLATSGHILGIVSPPVHPPKRRYWAAEATGFQDPEAWRMNLDKKNGSWWEDWVEWLAQHCGPLGAPPGRPAIKEDVGLIAAPGTYVLEN